MTSTGTVKVIGDISSETIRNLNAALKTLYANNSSVRVTLDLSRTTGLTELPSKAFADTNLDNPGCLALKGIVLPLGLLKISDFAFYRCSNLTEMITIPPTVTEICDSTFCYSGLSGTLNIPSSVRKLGYMTFSSTPNSLTLQYEDTTSTWTRYDFNGNVVTDGTAFHGTTPTKDVISQGSYRLLYIQKD
ncbi:MAG: leucine-rich repeat domain-containing protein [Treponema sp.]|nr:leucine-rich repeat domain-containing protein [Treponema sp.]